MTSGVSGRKGWGVEALFGSRFTGSTEEVSCRYTGNKLISRRHSYSPWVSQQRASFKELISAAISFPGVVLKDKEWMPGSLREGILGVRGPTTSPDIAPQFNEVWKHKRKWHEWERWVQEYKVIWTTAALRWHSFVSKTKTTFVSCSGSGCQQFRQSFEGAQTASPAWGNMAWPSLGKIKLTWPSLLFLARHNPCLWIIS